MGDQVAVLNGLLQAEVVSLAHPLRVGEARAALSPPYMHALLSPLGTTAGNLPGQSPEIHGATDAISLGAHTGTHVDGLAHVSYRRKLLDGTRIDDPGVQDAAHGIRMRTMENLRPVVSRGVLLDFARWLDVERIPGDYVITPDRLDACAADQGVQIRSGDTVLLRTGYDSIYHDADTFLEAPMPGPDTATAKALTARGIVATGSDTMPYEAVPSPDPLGVHAELIPKAGVFILEMLDLRALSERRPAEFLFVMAPLMISGGTGSPVNPLALIPANA
ncbi:cyclase family protein [Amycolatopsis balhimycina DSM 5908]|uniref:Cyclase family protein n=1 Tax=Amycolatopsis balhimycina DSM 5908 TaxID=1081091 RepID=A0A428WB72_AMYBA|nr:cyclase family protein [Amycolatopsis balhimycina]RSM40359.1 cyclase family protein [Amycolatopsis balhimycina DSM 5908]